MELHTGSLPLCPYCRVLGLLRCVSFSHFKDFSGTARLMTPNDSWYKKQEVFWDTMRLQIKTVTSDQ